MRDARRTVARWLLAALVERGVRDRPRHHWEAARIERPMSAAEVRQSLGPHSKLRFFPSPRRGVLPVS